MTSLLLASLIVGASAQVSDTFAVPVPTEVLARWVAANPDKIAQAAGSRVAWRKGDQFHVSRQTPRGTVEATLQDRILRVEGGYLYECRLIEGQNSDLRAYHLVCRLTTYGAKASSLSIQVQSTVDLPRVRDWQLERSMRQSLERVKQMFQSLR